MFKALFSQVAQYVKRSRFRSSLTTDFHTACHNRNWRKRPNVHKCEDGTWNFVDPFIQNEKTKKPVIVKGLSCYEAFSKLYELDQAEGLHQPVNGSHYSLLSHLENVMFDSATHKPHLHN